MVKLFLIPALALLHQVIAGGGTPDGISAVCNDDNTIDVTINYSEPSQILSATYGSCNKTQLGGTSGTSKTSWSIEMDPARCDMESKLRNLVYNQTASFTLGRTDGDVDIVFATMEVESYCNYTSEYTVSFSYGPVNADDYKFDTSGGLIDLQWVLISVNSAGTGIQDPSSTAGDTVHLLLGVSYAPHPGFVHAIPFSNQSTGMVYVPTKCEVTDDASNSYTLFETTNDAKCTNDIIDLDISYVVNGPLCGSTCNYWRFSHTLFLLNSETISSYELSCNILLCDAQRISECADAKKCLTGSA